MARGGSSAFRDRRRRVGNRRARFRLNTVYTEVVCPECGGSTRAALPPEAAGQFGPQLTALIRFGGTYQRAGELDRDTLDRWLTNPSALVPGTRMFFKIDDPQARADIIAYLKELK